MSIVRINRMNEFAPLQKEFGRLFEDMFPGVRVAQTVKSAEWRPSIDVHEDEQAYHVDVELAGINREDVKVNFEDGTLTISGERTYSSEQKEKNAHRVERFYGSFQRSLNFATSVNGDAITARFENGLLQITLPKADEVKPKQIAIS